MFTYKLSFEMNAPQLCHDGERLLILTGQYLMEEEAVCLVGGEEEVGDCWIVPCDVSGVVDTCIIAVATLTMHVWVSPTSTS